MVASTFAHSKSLKILIQNNENSMNILNLKKKKKEQRQETHTEAQRLHMWKAYIYTHSHHVMGN